MADPNEMPETAALSESTVEQTVAQVMPINEDTLLVLQLFDQMDATAPLMRLIIAAVIGLAIVPVSLALCRGFGIYCVVAECESQVFTLFGKVLGTIDEPGLRFPVVEFGPRALLIPFFGKRHRVNTALRQHYLRGQMVNSEEGTPMGVGRWYLSNT